MSTKFSQGDRVSYNGSVGTVTAVKMGGYLIDFAKSKNQFVYESELSLVSEADSEDVSSSV